MSIEPSEAEVLEGLIVHPGWLRFESYVEDEWGPRGVAFLSELDKALNLVDNDAAASQARQIRSGQKVILGLLKWPQARIAQLKRANEERASLSARPPLPQELVSQSRRGGM